MQLQAVGLATTEQVGPGARPFYRAHAPGVHLRPGHAASSAKSLQKRMKLAETLQCRHKLYTGFLLGVRLSQFLSPRTSLLLVFPDYSQLDTESGMG